jgi:cellulose synthase operon protein C
MSIKSLWPTKLISLSAVAAIGLSIAACSSPEERAKAHYESGKQLLEAGEFAKAGLEFRNALKFSEKLPSAWLGLAKVEEQRQNWPAVLDDLQHAIELDPKNLEALVQIAKLQLAAVQLDKALKNVNTANDIKKDDTDVLALRAAILFRLKDREGARNDAERALALNPDNPDAHAVLAADKMADGNSVAALQFIDRGLAKDQKNLGLLMFKLKIFEDNKDDAKLETVLRQIISSYPDMKEMRKALLGFLISRKRLPEAETEMRSAIAENPNDSERAMELVAFIGTVKGPDAARSELEKLIAAKPDVATYSMALAQMDFASNRSDAAIAGMEAIVAKGTPKEDVLRAQLLLTEMNLKLGQTEKAKVLVTKILSDDSKNAEALALRASISLDANEVDNAVADLREALNQEPNSIRFLIQLAHTHERQGAVGLANDRFVQALKISNYGPQIVLDYISFLQRRGKIDEVETIVADAVTRNPKDTRLLQELAKTKLNKQDWAGAQAIAETLKKIGDTSGVGDQIIGAIQLGQNKFDDSIATLKEAYTAKSSDQSTQPMYSLFFAYMKAGKIIEAEDFIQSVLKVNEKNAEARVLLGSIKLSQNKPEEAEVAYNLAIKNQPTSPIGYTALAKHYLSQGKIAEAEAVVKAGQEKLPHDADMNLILAGIFEQKNDFENAIAIYEKQLKATPDAVIFINNLASLLADHRTDAPSLDRARQLSQRLEAIDQPQLKDTLGWVAYRTGDYRTATTNLEDAVKKLPDIGLIRYHLGMTYIALKRDADAKEQFMKAEALAKGDNSLIEKIKAAKTSLGSGN